MLRFIVRETDIGAAANIGGPVNNTWVTIDGDTDRLEALLAEKKAWTTRELVGVEIIDTPRPQGEEKAK